MLLEDYPGYFMFGGLAAAIPAIWGARLWRVAGICLCIASIIAALMAFQHMRAHEARVHQISESGLQKCRHAA